MQTELTLRAKLRAAVRKLRNEYIFYMLDDALELLPPAKLHKIDMPRSVSPLASAALATRKRSDGAIGPVADCTLRAPSWLTICP